MISGVANTRVGEIAGSSCMSLHEEAARGALEDAGLNWSDIDGVLCAYSLAEPHPMLASAFCEFVGIHPNVCTALQSGGTTACIMVMLAVMLFLLGASFFGYQFSGLQLAFLAGIVLLMSALILYQTSEIIHGGETNYIMATTSLFLSIVNLFTSLLHLLGITSDE